MTNLDIVANAIKESVSKFESPVYLYIAPEARRRWDEKNPDDDWYDQPESRDDLASYRIIAEAVLKALGQRTRHERS